MPDVRPWARVVGDINVSVRRGAWYEVIRLTPDAAILDVNRRSLNVPRSAVQVKQVRPREWSVVARPYDAVDLPIVWGQRYGVCPSCSKRTALTTPGTDMQCPGCGRVFVIPSR
jgi:hypothetical protein